MRTEDRTVGVCTWYSAVFLVKVLEEGWTDNSHETAKKRQDEILNSVKRSNISNNLNNNVSQAKQANPEQSKNQNQAHARKLELRQTL